MPFVLSNNFIDQLKKIRQNYEKEAGIKLDKASQPYAISLFFGAKDVDSRKKQILLIEQWVEVFRHSSFTAALNSKEAFEDYITALHVLMTVTFYIKYQIDGTYTFGFGAPTLLERLMHEAMGVNPKNVIDDQTLASCLSATKRFLATEGSFESVNARLKTRITDEQWLDFVGFVTTQYKLLDEKLKTEYPITVVMMSAMEKPMELVGNATGYLAANVLVKSSAFHPVRYALTTMIGSGVFLLIGPTTNVGLLLLVPTISGQAIDFCCGASLAWAMGTALKWVGKGVGMGVGIPLDMSKKLAYKTYSLFESAPEQDPTLKGIVLTDGHPVVNGEDLSMDDFEDIDFEQLRLSGEKSLKMT